MEKFSLLADLVEPDLGLGASNAVERLFGGDGFRVWYGAVKSRPIEECGEPLAEIPADELPRMLPHAYEKIGAPYGGASPFFLRSGNVRRLREAQAALTAEHPGYRLSIFDGYRPLGVQRFLARHFFESLAAERGIEISRLSEQE